MTLAELYPHRWEEETAFNVLQMTLTCEHPGIGHPKAATFLFCISQLAFNLRQVIFATLLATHDQEEVEQTSHFHVSINVSEHTKGMLVVPSTLHQIVEYSPSLTGWQITAGIWAFGLMVYSVGLKIAIPIFQAAAADDHESGT